MGGGFALDAEWRLADEALPLVEAPTLLLVGERDEFVIELNDRARARTRADVRFEIVPGTTHLFEEAGALEEVAAFARDLFTVHLASTTTTTA